MALWTIVDYYDKKPINTYVYTTADSRAKAYFNFKSKWKKNAKHIPSPRQLSANIENSTWDIVEIEPKPREPRVVLPRLAPQLEFDL